MLLGFDLKIWQFYPKFGWKRIPIITSLGCTSSNTQLYLSQTTEKKHTHTKERKGNWRKYLKKTTKDLRLADV